MNFVRPSLLLGNRLDLASRLDAASLAAFQREVLSEQVRTIIRREIYLKYFARLAALAFVILVAAFGIQFIQVMGIPLRWDSWRFEMVWMLSVGVAGIAALLTAAQWWRSREQFVRTEIGLLQIRIQTDLADDDGNP